MAHWSLPARHSARVELSCSKGCIAFCRKSSESGGLPLIPARSAGLLSNFLKDFLNHVELAASHPLYVQRQAKLRFFPKEKADAIRFANL